MKNFKAFLFTAIALFALVGCQMASESPKAMDTEKNLENNEEMVESTSNAKVFTLTGENFKFLMDGQEAPEIRVKKGDLVRIEFTSTSGFHDWVVDEFNAATEKVRDGGSTSIEFLADQSGTFEYYCSVGSHRANGMKGALIVE